MKTLGLGFIFGAKTSNYLGRTRQVEKGLSGVSSQMGRLDRISKSNTFGNFLSGLKLNALGDVREQMEKVLGMDSDVAKLTSELEKFGIEADKSFRKMTAGMGLSEKTVASWGAKVAGTAKGLNLDVDKVGESFKGLEQQGLSLKDLGISSFQAWVKATEVAGLEPAKLTATLGELTKQYGVSSKEAGALLDDFTKLGEISKMGAGSVGFLSEAFTTLTNILGPQATGKDITTMLRSTQALGGAFQMAFGGEVQVNLASVLKLTEKLATGSVDYEKALSGLKGEFPEIGAQLAESFGSVEQALGLLKTGDVVGFAKSVGGLAQRFQQVGGGAKGGLDVFMKRLYFNLQEIDPTLALMVTKSDALAGAFAKLGDPTKGIPGATGAFEKLGKQFRTGRGLADDMQLKLDQFRDSIRGITRAKIGKVFSQKIFPSMDKFAKRLTEIGTKDTGLMGGLIRSISEFDQIGLGVLPLWFGEAGEKMYVWGQTLSPLKKMLDPLVDSLWKLTVALPGIVVAFGTIGGAVEAALTPVGLLVLGVGALAGVFALGTKRGTEFTDWLLGKLDVLVPKADVLLNKLADTILGWADQLVGGPQLGATMGRGVDNLTRIFAKVALLGPAVQRMGKALWSLLQAGFTWAMASLRTYDWRGQLFQPLIATLAAAGRDVADQLASALFGERWLQVSLEQTLASALADLDWSWVFGGVRRKGVVDYFLDALGTANEWASSLLDWMTRWFTKDTLFDCLTTVAAGLAYVFDKGLVSGMQRGAKRANLASKLVDLFFGFLKLAPKMAGILALAIVATVTLCAVLLPAALVAPFAAVGYAIYKALEDTFLSDYIKSNLSRIIVMALSASILAVPAMLIGLPIMLGYLIYKHVLIPATEWLTKKFGMSKDTGFAALFFGSLFTLPTLLLGMPVLLGKLLLDYVFRPAFDWLSTQIVDDIDKLVSLITGRVREIRIEGLLRSKPTKAPLPAPTAIEESHAGGGLLGADTSYGTRPYVTSQTPPGGGAPSYMTGAQRNAAAAAARDATAQAKAATEQRSATAKLAEAEGKVRKFLTTKDESTNTMIKAMTEGFLLLHGDGMQLIAQGKERPRGGARGPSELLGLE